MTVGVRCRRMERTCTGIPATGYYDDAAVDLLAGYDAFSGAVKFVDQGHVADARFEGLDAFE